MKKGGKSYEENLKSYEWKMSMVPEECRQYVALRRIQHIYTKYRIVFSNIIWQLTGVKGLSTMKNIQNMQDDLESALKSIIGKEDKKAKRFLYLEQSPEELGELLFVSLYVFSFLNSIEKKLERAIDVGMRKTGWYQNVIVPASRGLGIGGGLACDLLWYIVTPSRFKSLYRRRK